MAALGSTPGIIVGTGVGLAAGIALQPAFELPKQKAWQANPNKVLDPGLVARLVAQGGITLEAAKEDAAREGLAGDKLEALVYLAQTVPAVAEAITLWRRGLISDELWRHVLVKEGLDTRYVDALTKLKLSEPLDPAVIATAIQRGIMHDPGFLPVAPPTTKGKVPAFPVSALDAVAEAALSGLERDRLFVETAIVGLPASPDLAARMVYRAIVDRADFDRAVSEGNTRNEWRDALFEGFREILTAHDYAELELRGYYDRKTRLANTAKHGMSEQDSDLLFDVLGRSIPVHQITTGEARGGSYKGDSSGIPEPFLRSLQRGNLRPEYYSLAYANRYSYPSAFVIRALLTDGAIDEAEGEQIFLNIGWPPELAKKVAAHYAAGGAGTGDKHVTKAQTQLWSATHRSYIAEEAVDADAKTRLTALEIPEPAQAQVLELWKLERSLIRAQLSPAQIKKAVGGAVTNPATGRPWTEAEGVQALLDRGYDRADALTLLAE